jgi:hypothetical protein
VLQAGNANVVVGAASRAASPLIPGDRAAREAPLSGEPLPTTTTALAKRAGAGEAGEESLERAAALATSASVGEA